MAEWLPPGPMRLGWGPQWRERRAGEAGERARDQLQSPRGLPGMPSQLSLTWAAFSGGTRGRQCHLLG